MGLKSDATLPSGPAPLKHLLASVARTRLKGLQWLPSAHRRAGGLLRVTLEDPSHPGNDLPVPCPPVLPGVCQNPQCHIQVFPEGDICLLKARLLPGKPLNHPDRVTSLLLLKAAQPTPARHLYRLRVGVPSSRKPSLTAPDTASVSLGSPSPPHFLQLHPTPSPRGPTVYPTLGATHSLIPRAVIVCHLCAGHCRRHGDTAATKTVAKPCLSWGPSIHCGDGRGHMLPNNGTWGLVITLTK